MPPISVDLLRAWRKEYICTHSFNALKGELLAQAASRGVIDKKRQFDSTAERAVRVLDVLRRDGWARAEERRQLAVGCGPNERCEGLGAERRFIYSLTTSVEEPPV